MASPLVSVCIVTYQHANFIAQAIEGVLMQETDFPVEILIGEDESSDGTREICQEFARLHPGRIRLFLRQRKDVIQIDGRDTGRYNFYATLRESQGRYVALCDGDDYWTDPSKLARQVKLLEQNPEVAISFHETQLLSPDRSLTPLCGFSDGVEFQRSDLITSNFIPSMSVLFRRPPDWSILEDVGTAVAGDWILNLQLAQFGGIKYSARAMAVYRMHTEGTWQSRSTESKAAAIAKLATRVRSLLPTYSHGLSELWRQQQENIQTLERERKRWEIAATRAAEEATAAQTHAMEVEKERELLEKERKQWEIAATDAAAMVSAVQTQAKDTESNLAWLEQERSRWEEAATLANAHVEKFENLSKLEKRRFKELNSKVTELEGTIADCKNYIAELVTVRDLLRSELAERNQNTGGGYLARISSLSAALRHMSAITFRRVRPLEDHHYFDQILDDTVTGQRVYSGWYFRPGEILSALRAVHITSAGISYLAAESSHRMDVEAAFPQEIAARKSGFKINVPVLPGFNFIELQYAEGKSWVPFRRETRWGTVNLALPLPRFHDQHRTPLVGFVIPCYNQADFVIEAVDSVLAQTWTDFELIVVNDGSTDSSVAEKLDRLPSDPRLRVMHQSNQGLAQARNNGIQASTTEYVCCLDADDRLDATYAEKCLVTLFCTGTDICGSWQQNFGDDCSQLRPGSFTVQNLWWENRMVNVAVFRRKLWEAVGGYDPAMSLGYEDWDFWMKCAVKGARASVVTEALFFYRKHGPSMIDQAQANHHELADRIRQSRTETNRSFQLQATIDSVPISDLTRRLTPPTDEQHGILLVLPFLVLGGVETLLSRTGSQLSQRGFRYTVCTTEPVDPEMGDSTPKFAIFTNDIHHLPRFLDSAQWLDYIDHLITSRNIKTLWLAGSKLLYNCLPQLHRRHPDLRVIDHLFNSVGHTESNRRYAHHIDCTMVENKEVAEWLIAAGEWPARISLIPNGVDTTRFKPRADAKSILPTRCRTRFVVGYFGRFSPEKAPDDLIAMARLAAAENLELHFILGGTGSQIEIVKNALAEPALAEIMDYVGIVNTTEWLPACDALVLPSRLDGRPNVVLEALSCGVPVVASSVGGLPEMVDEGKSGWLIDSGDIRAFLERLQQLAQQPELRDRMSRRAREQAIEQFDIQQMIDLYEKVLLGQSTPPVGNFNSPDNMR